jgi:predicted RNA-binding Zn-ribbon protein involved in translation (DUF1610 family)
VADIHQNLVPYHRFRAELEVTTVSEYEQVLLCYLAGIGGYVRMFPAEAQQEIFDALGSADLDRGLYRNYSKADVFLNATEVDMESTESGMTDLPLFDDCPSCSEELPKEGGVKFCPFCGEDVQRVLCESCSRKLRLNWKFCVGCGKEVAADDGH